MIKPTIIIVMASLSYPFLPPMTSYPAPEIAVAAPGEAPVEKAEQTIWTETEIFDIAREMADKYGVSRETMIRVTNCEAPWHMDGSGTRIYDKNDAQSRFTYNEDQIRRHPNWGEVGDREDSWGPVQIHRPGKDDGWPEITREQARDPYFALDFMARSFKKDKEKLWTCF